MSNSERRLAAVALAAEDLRDARTDIRKRVQRMIAAEIAEKEFAFEEAVLSAIETESIANVARALTPPGSTPNRARVYQVLNKHKIAGKRAQAHYPLEWVEREVETFDGNYTVYDVVGTFEAFGPDKINGTFRWTYDTSGLTQVYDPEGEPYPATSAYKKAIDNWLASHPYPGAPF